MKILYANDLHASGPFPAHYPKTEIAVPKFFEMLRENPHGVEHVVIGGDCVNRGPAEIDELRWMHAQLESTGIPYHVVAGNHDIAPSSEFADRYPGMEDMENCPLEETNFGQVFGEKGIRSVIALGAWQLVMFSIRNKDADGQLTWLEEQLSKPGPILLVGHYPLIPSRNGGYCEEWGYSRIRLVRSQLLNLIQTNDERVRAYFCGHQHINSQVAIGDAQQIVTGSVGLATCCYRILEIEDEKISVTTHRLNDIPNWLDDVMNPDRSSDNDHPTLESYHWGNENERTFEISAQKGHVQPTPEHHPQPTSEHQPNNPMHGITLERIINSLVTNYGWHELGDRINIKCFQDNPSVKSSLKFLRKTPWARQKVEDLYLRMQKTTRQ